MRLRRCAIVSIEPRERLDFDLGLLMAGETGVRSIVECMALAPHLDTEVVVDGAEVAVLAALSPTHWVERGQLAEQSSPELLDALLRKGLIVAEDTVHADMRARDEAVRAAHWHGTAAIAHRFTRWRGVDTEEASQRFAEETDQGFLERLGPAPPHFHERVEVAQRQPLAAAGSTPLDALLARRVTCRNYDVSRSIAAEDFAAILFRVFGARAVSEYAPGVHLLKKGVPSAGGLHPVEAYLLVQRVDGVEPGLYHYHPGDHALEPLRKLAGDEAAALAAKLVAAQGYFADANVLIALTGRFRRNFWKYRNHAKAYRAVILDAGHLSQTLYLSATELGLGAFITAAVNEVDIEQAFGLDPLQEGPLAVCGFGIRAAERREVEFDPLNAVWA